MSEKVLYQASPSMFRNRPILFLICVALIIAYGAGLLILFLWWMQAKGITLTVTNERTTLRRGTLSKSTTEVWHQDVRNVQINQTFMQRIFGVGEINISSAGQAGFEVSVRGIRSPGKVKQIIDENRRATRR